jgi:hypothetical protein
MLYALRKRILADGGARALGSSLRERPLERNLELFRNRCYCRESHYQDSAKACPNG